MNQCGNQWISCAKMFPSFYEPSWTLKTFLPLSDEDISLYGCNCNKVRNKHLSSFPSGFGSSVGMHVKDEVPHYRCATDVFWSLNYFQTQSISSLVFTFYSHQSDRRDEADAQGCCPAAELCDEVSERSWGFFWTPSFASVEKRRVSVLRASPADMDLWIWRCDVVVIFHHPSSWPRVTNTRSGWFCWPTSFY